MIVLSRSKNAAVRVGTPLMVRSRSVNFVVHSGACRSTGRRILPLSARGRRAWLLGMPGVVVGVVGGSGGVGASTFASPSLPRGRGATLIDLDPVGGGIDVLLGIEDAARRAVVGAAGGRRLARPGAAGGWAAALARRGGARGRRAAADAGGGAQVIAAARAARRRGARPAAGAVADARRRARQCCTVCVAGGGRARSGRRRRGDVRWSATLSGRAASGLVMPTRRAMAVAGRWPLLGRCRCSDGAAVGRPPVAGVGVATGRWTVSWTDWAAHDRTRRPGSASG